MPDSLSKSITNLLKKRPKNRGELWELYNAISSEIMGKYELSIDVHQKDEDTVETVYNITDFDKAELSAGEFTYEYPDFHEIFSEGIQLTLSGITDFTIKRSEISKKRKIKKKKI